VVTAPIWLHAAAATAPVALDAGGGAPAGAGPGTLPATGSAVAWPAALAATATALGGFALRRRAHF
jgi:LPXTG-motif cell wall-anchored protein